jgi:hypothetical protein
MNELINIVTRSTNGNFVQVNLTVSAWSIWCRTLWAGVSDEVHAVGHFYMPHASTARNYLGQMGNFTSKMSVHFVGGSVW